MDALVGPLGRIAILAVLCVGGTACGDPTLGPGTVRGETDEEPARYRVRGLMFASGVQSTAHDLNDEGVVVGVVSGQPVRWVLDENLRPGDPIQLELPGGGDPGPGEAMGINDLGHVVGMLAGDTVRPFIWTEASGLRVLSLPAGAESGVAYDINEAGEVVGSVSADPAFTTVEEGRLVKWTVDVGGEVLDVVDIGTLDGTGARGHAINEAGSIAGIVWYDGGATQSGFVWHPVADLEKMPLEADALGMNDRGYVIGSFEGRAAYWAAGSVQPIAPPGSVGYAINDDRVMVGEAAIENRSGPRAGFVIVDGALSVLETLALVEYARPRAVNDAGIIAGNVFTEGPDVSEAAIWILR